MQRELDVKGVIRVRTWMTSCVEADTRDRCLVMCIGWVIRLSKNIGSGKNGYVPHTVVTNSRNETLVLRMEHSASVIGKIGVRERYRLPWLNASNNH